MSNIPIFRYFKKIGGDVESRTPVLKQLILASTCLAELKNFTS